MLAFYLIVPACASNRAMRLRGAICVTKREATLHMPTLEDEWRAESEAH